VVVAPSFASLGDRLAAQLVDGLIAFGLLFLTGALFVPRVIGFVGPAVDARIVGAGIALVITGLCLLLYFIAFEKQLGLTLGKVAAGIRVRSGAGGRVSGRAAFVRNIVRVAEALTFYIVSAFLVLITRRSQRLGDLFADTIVVRHEAPRPVRVAALLLALLVAIGGVVGGLAVNGVGPAQSEMFLPPGVAPSPSPSSPPGRPRIASAILTDSPTIDANRTTFAPDTPEIYARVTLADVPPGSTLQAIWIAESVAGRPNDSRMDESPPSEVGGTRNQANLSHQRPPNGWPTGAYRIDLYLSGQFEQTLRFTVQPGVSSPVTTVSPVPTSITIATPGPTSITTQAAATPSAALSPTISATSTAVLTRTPVGTLPPPPPPAPPPFVEPSPANEEPAQLPGTI
jgi:uncharacterized RDD family membrane protein YckC